MTLLQPPAGRASIRDEPNGLRIVIPSQKNWFAILFIAFWLCGWAFGEHFAIGQIREGKGSLFMIGWLGAWTVGGAWAIYTWLWMVLGR